MKKKYDTNSKFIESLFGDDSLEGTNIDKEKFKQQLVSEITQGLFGEWKKPWRCYCTRKYFFVGSKRIAELSNINGRAYRNMYNLLALSRLNSSIPIFMSLAQVKKANGDVIDEKKVVSVVEFFKPYKKVKEKDEDGNEIVKTKKMGGKAMSFDVVTPIENVENMEFPQIRAVEMNKIEFVEYVDNVIAAYSPRVAKVFHDQKDKNYFTPTFDEIHLTPAESFDQINAYYSTRFHETIHSTLMKKRCDRTDWEDKSFGFGSSYYAIEELVAEMGSLLLCTQLGLQYTRKNSLAYLGSWLRVAKEIFDNNEEKTLLTAFGRASDAVDYILDGIDLEAMLPESVKAQIGADQNIVFEKYGIKIVRNNDIDRTQIFFKEFPANELHQLLKDNHFAWSRVNRAFHGQNTDEAIATAKRIIEDYFSNHKPINADQSKIKAKAKIKIMKMKLELLKM